MQRQVRVEGQNKEFNHIMLKHNFYIDCTDLIETNLNTGIQRVARNIIDFRFSAQQKLSLTYQLVYYNMHYGFIKVPGYNNNDIKESIGYLYSVRFCLPQVWRFKRLAKAIFPFPKFQEWLEHHWKGKNRFLLMWPFLLIVAPIITIALIYTTLIPLQNYWKPSKNDILIIPGASWWVFNLQDGLNEVKANLGRVVIIIYDLIPLTHPHFFTGWLLNNFTSKFSLTTSTTDLFIAISQTTEDTLKQYLFEKIPSKIPATSHFLLGADLDLIDQTLHVRKSLETLFSESKPYLCVGTIEPRKNHVFLLDAFDKIWKNNHDVHLCIVGCYGWKSEILEERISKHPLFGRNLRWFKDLNDTELSFCYKNSKALIFPSIIEGFGLPLIEALHYGCPVMASDIPVFREIGGDNCSYFSIDSPDDLISEINHFESLGILSGTKQTGDFEWINWEDSALQFYTIIAEHFGRV